MLVIVVENAPPRLRGRLVFPTRVGMNRYHCCRTNRIPRRFPTSLRAGFRLPVAKSHFIVLAENSLFSLKWTK
jgi:hypothetical protein